MSLRRFSWLTLGFSLAVIVWGAFVRASGSGAGCGRHWPLCNGTVLPLDPGIETLIELTHRLTSGLALLLVVALVVWVYRTTGRGHRLRRSAGLALVFIVIEALVGAGLVLLELVGDEDSMLRAAYLAVHLANTLLLLAFLGLTALWADRPDPGTGSLSARITKLGWTVLGALMIVGATGAVTALGDTLFPSTSLREGLAIDASAAAPLLLRLRVIHPALAVIAAILAVVLAVGALNRGEPTRVGPPARWVIGLAVMQLAVGVINLLLLVPVATQLLHLFMADLLWLATVFLVAEMGEPA